MIEEASKRAKENVEHYLEAFRAKLESSAQQIDAAKFRDPNTQFLLNSSITAVARKGKRIDANILSDLILAIVNKDSSDILAQVSEEAVETLPKLSKEQIAILTMLHFLLHMRIGEISDASQLDQIATTILGLSQDGFQVTESGLSHLQYLGVVSINQFQGIDIYSILKQTYRIFADTSADDIKKEVTAKAPVMSALIGTFERREMRRISLTPVGKLIGLVNINRYIPGLRYSEWIN